MAEALEDMVLVSGASGYLACHVTQQLLRAGYKVRGTVRSLGNEKKVAPLKNLCPEARHPLELVEADLLKPETWVDAVRGCKYVMHVASPFPAENPKHEDEVVKPAVEGTLNVLKACKEVGGVKRVILTSSVAAVYGGLDPEKGKQYDESDWTDVKHPVPYIKSKVLAEKAAWEYVDTLPEDSKFELAVVNPGYIMGPILSGDMATSMEIPMRLLRRDMPMLPDIGFDVVDVRDVAAAHLRAMTLPEAAGQRHIAVTSVLSIQDMAKIMTEEFKPQGYNVPTTVAPNFMIKFAGLFDKSIKMITPGLGRRPCTSNKRMLEVLKIEPYDAKNTVIDMCYDCIERGFVKKTSKYTGPK